MRIPPTRIPGTYLALLLLPALLPLSVPAQEAPGPEGKEALREVLQGLRKSHSSPYEEGLRTFRARLEFLDIQPGRDPLSGRLEWKGPGKGEFTPLPAGPARRKKGKGRADKKDWRPSALQGVGDALAGASFHALLAKGDRTGIDPEKSGPRKTVIQVFRKKRPLGRAVFSKSSGLLEKLRLPPWEWTFRYAGAGGRMLLERAVLTRRGGSPGKGRRHRSVKFSGYRKICGFFLPTRITLSAPPGSAEASIAYETINGKPALSDAADPEVLARALRDFESNWRRWTPGKKVEALRELARMGGPKVALALARRLRERSPQVREALVRALGDMKERAALPYLVRALGAARKDPAFFVLLCKALGRIGDPRAVKPLSKKILSGDAKTTEWRLMAQARISALASIRSPESVDALIKLLSMGGGRGRRATSGGKGPLTKYVQAALTKLTGERFKFAYQWHKWWKAHRAGFFREKK